MNIRQLRKILNDLPPELDEAVILTGTYLDEATRLIYHPNIGRVGLLTSYQRYEHAIMFDNGGELLGPGAEESGVKVLALETEPAKFITVDP